MGALLLLIINVLFIVLLLRYKKNYSNALISLLTALFFYASFFIAIKIDGYMLEQHANSFDLDGDGMFSASEITPGQAKASFAYTNDLGRNLAPYIGIVLAVLYFVVLFAVLSIMGRKKTLKNKTIYAPPANLP